jgi:hypothetical protein
MSSSQFSAWESSQLDQDIRDEADGVANDADAREWQAFQAEQAELEREAAAEALFNDPAYVEQLERQWSYYPDAA